MLSLFIFSDMNVDSLSSSLSQSNILVLSNKKNKKDLNNVSFLVIIIK